MDYSYDDNEEYGYPNKKRRFSFGKLLKIIFYAFLACFCVALAFRLYTHSYYPSEMTKLYFNDTLTEHYYSTDNFVAYTQELGYHYDDPDYKDNYFFAEGLIYIPEAKQLQVVLRYNNSALEKLKTKYELAETPVAPVVPKGSADAENASHGLFNFTLVTLYEDKEDKEKELVRRYECSYLYTDEAFMYNYVKLVFDGVEFEDGANWLRVDTYFKSHETPDEDKPLAMNLVWQLNRPSDEYKLSKSEVPAR